MRAQQGEAAAFAVEIRSSASRTDTVPYATSRVVPLAALAADTRALVAVARAGLQRIYKPGPAYAKAGVILLDLTRAAQRQPDLFVEPSARERSEALMATLDQINRRFGRGSLSLANARRHRAGADASGSAHRVTPRAWMCYRSPTARKG